MIRPDKGRPYWNPYVAGAALGVVVTIAFAAGHYFGASRVFATLAKLVRGGAANLDHWMSWELLGVALGGVIGAVLARRWALRVERGSRVSPGSRLALAAVGGALVMLGSRFAYGCTSGIALSGGTRMSIGAYVFVGTMFAGGFLMAGLARRLWS